MKFIVKISCVCFAAIALFACQPHVPEVEQLPQETINFTYEVIGDTVYNLDYYVGATIKFYPTTPLTDADGDLTWNFGDATAPEVGDTVSHKFTVAGNYKVTVTTTKGDSKTNVIYISDIKPIVSLIQTDSLCVVDSSYISFHIELPNPDKLEEVYHWTFPEGTTNEAGEAVASFTGTYEELGKVKFARVGSQAVKVQVELGGRPLELVTKNVQVALNVEAPTLYYAVKEGNIMSIKVPATPVEGVTIDPYDMGVSSGQHPFNILFNKGLLYILDAGKNFVYQNEDGQATGGDGQIMVMSKDASTVEQMLSNVGGPGFQDPFYGYIDTLTNNLYYSDRNTGMITVPLTTRNDVYSSSKFSYFVQNNYLGCYGRGLSYGAITSCFGKVGDVYYWAKTYNGNGIWRFGADEILTEPCDPLKHADLKLPAVLTAFSPKSFTYNPVTEDFFFTIYGPGEGFYKCKIADLEGIADTKTLAPYEITFADGKKATQIAVNSVGEGSAGEYIGITELALDEVTGNVYFGLRSGDASVPSGLVMYNASTNKLEYLIEGIQVYGVAINKVPSQLF